MSDYKLEISGDMVFVFVIWLCSEGEKLLLGMGDWIVVDLV